MFIGPFVPLRGGMVLLGLSYYLCAVDALADTPDDTKASRGGIEEVVVTARKREESLQEAPIAVTAFDPESMRSARIQSLGEVAKEVPGLNMSEESKGAGMTIRGIGGAGDLRTEPGVGLYIDSVYIPKLDTQIVSVINMQSVQVLRGPQGTLFGKNTAGGAMLVTTRKPGPELEGFVAGDVGNYNNKQLRAGVSGPLMGDSLMAGIIVDRIKTDGYMTDIETGTDYGNKNKKAVMGQLRYEPSDALTADQLAFWGKEEENALSTTCFLANPSAPLSQRTAPGEERSYHELCAISERAGDDGGVLMDTHELSWETENKLGGITIQWDIAEVTIKSVTGVVQQSDVVRDRDQDATPLFAILNKTEAMRQLEANGISSDGEQRLFVSQEFDFFGSAFDGFMDYTIGVFASRETIDDTINGQYIGFGGYIGTINDNDFAPGLQSIQATPPDVAGVQGLYSANFDNRSGAIFSQLNFYLNEQLQLTLGGRYSWEKKFAEQDNYDMDPDFKAGGSRRNELPGADMSFVMKRRDLTPEEEATLDPGLVGFLYKN